MDRGQWARHFEGGLVQPGKRILDGGRAGGGGTKAWKELSGMAGEWGRSSWWFLQERCEF